MDLKRDIRSKENKGCCKAADDDISRRELFKSTSSLAGAAGLLSIKNLNAASRMACGSVRPPTAGLPETGDVLVFAEGEHKGNPILIENVVVAAPPVLALPKDPSSGTIRDESGSILLLYRCDPDKVPADLQDSAAQGVLAYSAVCTHLGCRVDGWVADKKLFQCPCHDAMFDPMQGGKVVTGPGPRPLPILPLKVQETKLVVAGDFSGRVGPQK
jgi:rieske iron-sulfur protein